MNKQQRKLILNLIKNCFWGVLALIAALWFVRYLIQVNPYYEYMLITKSKIAIGFITNVDEYEDEVEIPDYQGGGSEMVTVDNYGYTFTTQDGKVINDRSSDLGYMKEFKGKPLSIQVEYLPNKPEINRVKDKTNQCKTIGEFIWRRLGLGLFLLVIFLSIGFELIRKAIKDYLKESRALIASL